MALQQFNICASSNAHALYPCDTFFGVLYCSEDKLIGLPKLSPASGEWGSVLSMQYLLEDEYTMPEFLDMVYLSIVEKTFYSIEEELLSKEMEQKWKKVDNKTQKPLFEHVVIGMAPYGKVAVWLCGTKKEILVSWIQGEKVEVEMSEYMPHDPHRELNEVCSSFINSEPAVKKNLDKNGLPPHDLFDNYMKQYIYRYYVMFEHWDTDKEKWQKYEEEKIIPEFDYIEEALYDGTHDKMHDGGLMNYHEAGKPKKLAVQWHIGKKEWTTYLWFEDEEIRAVFDRFYGAHPETKTDFIVRIDPEKNKYELALYRYGLKEPQIIPEKTYQLLVFKNKFECFRSENYNQPKGAWIW